MNDMNPYYDKLDDVLDGLMLVNKMLQGGKTESEKVMNHFSLQSYKNQGRHSRFLAGKTKIVVTTTLSAFYYAKSMQGLSLCSLASLGDPEYAKCT